jgi:hypothetical protein
MINTPDEIHSDDFKTPIALKTEFWTGFSTKMLTKNAVAN